MVAGSRVDSFTEFVASYEARLRESLMAACGGERGRDAAAEALEYGWAHWDRVRAMENPVGYTRWGGDAGMAQGFRLHRRCRDRRLDYPEVATKPEKL